MPPSRLWVCGACDLVGARPGDTVTYQLLHDGVLREFELFAPTGWPYWLQQAHAQDGREGLPLVVALHGGGETPQTFGAHWPFFRLLDPTCADHLPGWEDKFYVLYPFGSSSSPRTACAPPGAADGEPLRGWNTGFSGDIMPARDDVSFVVAAIGAAETMLQAELDRLGIVLPAVDEDRRFAFGYSMGGMMAYRLAHEVPDLLAALWVMAGTIGGRAHDGLTDLVVNAPTGRGVSLFVHHGGSDIVVPPGGGIGGSPDPILSVASLARYAALPAADAAAYATSVLPVEEAVRIVVEHDGLPSTPVLTVLAASLGPLPASSHRIYTAGALGDNPTVSVYRDPSMAHTGFATSSNRYFLPADVWDFFRRHPRPTA